MASGAFRISIRVKAESGTCVLPFDAAVADALLLDVLVAVVPALDTPLVDFT
jgi:hypothetical protein